MELFLRKVIHPQARDNYRVILKEDGLEIEAGSIGAQHEGWSRDVTEEIVRELRERCSDQGRVPPSLETLLRQARARSRKLDKT